VDNDVAGIAQRSAADRHGSAFRRRNCDEYDRCGRVESNEKLKS
jgi:hypothetical protein